jgi:hypothetical protein
VEFFVVRFVSSSKVKENGDIIMAIVKKPVAVKRNKAVKQNNAAKGANIVEQFKTSIANMPKAIEQEHAKLTAQLVTMKKALDKAKIESKKFKSKASFLVSKHPGKKSVVVSKEITKMKAAYMEAAAKWESINQENEAIKNQVVLAKGYIKIAKQTAMFIMKLEKELFAAIKLSKSVKAKPVKAKPVKAKPAKAKSAKADTEVKLESAKVKTKSKPKTQIKEDEYLVNNNDVDDFVESVEKELAVVAATSDSDALAFELS